MMKNDARNIVKPREEAKVRAPAHVVILHSYFLMWCIAVYGVWGMKNEENCTLCKSVFKNGETVSKKDFTRIWIYLINQLAISSAYRYSSVYVSNVKGDVVTSIEQPK